MSLVHLHRRFFLPSNPFVMAKGPIEHWPARGGAGPGRSWRAAGRLWRALALRHVPVEAGRSYASEGWGQGLMRGSEFLSRAFPRAFRDDSASGDHATRPREAVAPVPPPPKRAVAPARAAGGAAGGGADGVVYLAQHALLDQIPTLRADVGIPELCALARDGAPGGAPRLNAWLGPEGTISDLHTDRDDNVLCQIVGRKRVLLLEPEHGAALGTRGGAMANTSSADPEDAATRRRLASLGFSLLEAEIGPGEALFIPRGWWHHVRALTPSASVSFWWS